MELRLKLADLLISHHACSSNEEAEVIAEIVLELDDDDDDDENENENLLNSRSDDNDDIFSKKDILVENLVDNLGVADDQAKMIILDLQRSYNSSAHSDEDSRDSEGSDNDDGEEPLSLEDNNDNEEEDDRVEYLIDGECELCDRYIKLTRHHLIPKSTWPRMQTKLLHAAEANENGDREKALLILGPGLEDVLNDSHSHRRCRSFLLSSDKVSIRAILHDTCDICRQCHWTVHQTHTNMELALFFSTVEKLLEDEKISKFCKWASKQKTGKYNRD